MSDFKQREGGLTGREKRQDGFVGEPKWTQHLKLRKIMICTSTTVLSFYTQKHLRLDQCLKYQPARLGW
jgi:hypothetical protein